MTGSACLQGHLSASSWPFITDLPGPCMQLLLLPPHAHRVPNLSPPSLEEILTIQKSDICVILHSLRKPFFVLLPRDLVQSCALIIVRN